MKPKVFIATPMYGGLCNGLYTIGMIQVPTVFSQAGLQFQYSTLLNESLIQRARNHLAKEFMDSDSTHLMFIDGDLGFDPRDILSMLIANKDIICGIYPKKEINWPLIESAVKQGVPMQELPNYSGTFVINLLDDAQSATFRIGEPLQISNGGTGFMLIQRHVLESLKEVVPTYLHDLYLTQDTQKKPRLISEFFATSIDESSQRLLSEDYHFCKIARSYGFQVWAAPWTRLVHCGTHNFSGMIPRTS